MSNTEHLNKLYAARIADLEARCAGAEAALAPLREKLADAEYRAVEAENQAAGLEHLVPQGLGGVYTAGIPVPDDVRYLVAVVGGSIFQRTHIADEWRRIGPGNNSRIYSTQDVVAEWGPLFAPADGFDDRWVREMDAMHEAIRRLRHGIREWEPSIFDEAAYGDLCAAIKSRLDADAARIRVLEQDLRRAQDDRDYWRTKGDRDILTGGGEAS